MWNYRLPSLLGLLLIAFAGTVSLAQDVNLESLSARMSDGVQFEISLNSRKQSKDLSVKFIVHNCSESDIYLVKEPSPVLVFERPIIYVTSPIPSSSGHGRENLDFVKIKVGTTYEGAITITGELFDQGKYSKLVIGMAYMREFEEVKSAKSKDDLWGKLRNNVFMRAETVRIGMLSF